MLQIVTQSMEKEEAFELIPMLVQLPGSLSVIDFIKDASKTHAHESY